MYFLRHIINVNAPLLTSPFFVALVDSSLMGPPSSFRCSGAHVADRTLFIGCSPLVVTLCVSLPTPRFLHFPQFSLPCVPYIVTFSRLRPFFMIGCRISHRRVWQASWCGTRGTTSQPSGTSPTPSRLSSEPCKTCETITRSIIRFTAAR